MLDPQNPWVNIELDGIHLESKSWGGTDKQPGTRWPVRLSYLASTRPVRDPVVNNKGTLPEQ